MEYLVVEATPSVRESLCYVLLSFGIKALQILQSGRAVTGAIIDLDGKDVGGLELIQDLRGAEATQGVRVIVHTVQASKELVARMMELCVVGYLLKPYNEKEIQARLKKALARGETHNSQRKHIRVRPDPDELLRLHFKLPKHPSLLSGKVVDISLGGVAVELFNPPPPDVLRPGTQVPAIQFTLNREPFSPPGKVVLFKEQLLALRFDFLTPPETGALSKYVFKRLTD
jgi:CheY-like chemotaxis protein